MRREQMLASSGAVRPAVEPPPLSEGPSVDDLTLPEAQIRDAGVRTLISLVQKAQQLRVATFGNFDDAFERLVTVGDADGYPACVERFKPKFAALDSNLERCAMRLDALQQAPCGTLVRSITRNERLRFEAKCDEQVLRQRLSLTELESEERPDLKSKVQAKSEALAAHAMAVEEALEELRAEAADVEEDDE